MKVRAGLFSILMLAVSNLDVATAHADTFLLDNGESLQGTIISSIGNTISIKLDGRGMRQLPIKVVDQVEVELLSGEQAVGKLFGWSKKTYKIVAEDRLLSISNGEIITNVAADLEATDEVSEDNGIGGPSLALVNPEDPTDAQDDIENPMPTAGDNALPVLSWSISQASENAGEAVVLFSLSKKVSRPIVVIYSAMDGSAKGGADYQKAAGVLIIEPDISNAEVRIPIVDDDQTEPDEAFEIFLSVDPEIVRANSRNIVVTIQDDDL